MQSLNLTIQQYTPLISYAPSDTWRLGSTADNFYSKYDDGFKLTTANGSTATFDFTGTGVWIYGAYRPNHGNFSVTLDGKPQGVYNGSTSDNYQAVLYGIGDLENRKHSVVLTNRPLSEAHQYLDIDFITYEIQLNEDSTDVQVDMSSGNWTHDQSWSLANGTTQDALLTSTTSGAKTTLTFQGESVEVYGSIGPLYSQFEVSVDGGASTTLDCFYDETRPSVLLWSANSLGDGLHKLEITNQPNKPSQNKLGLDYALVRGTSNPTSASPTTTPVAPVRTDLPAHNTAFESNTGAIIGCVIAAVVFLVIVATVAFHWRRKIRLGQRPPSTYIPPTSSSRNILPVTNLPAGNRLQGSHPKYGAPVRATRANPAIYGNMPQERVPLSHDPVSSNDSGLSSTVGAASQLSSSTAASSNAMSQQPMPLPVSSYSSDARPVHQPRERSAQPLSRLPPEPRAQPLPPAQPRPSTEPRQRNSASALTYSSAYTSNSTGSLGVQVPHAHQPHPNSIFGDQNDNSDRSDSQSELLGPPPDYWSSAGQGAR